MFYLQTTTTLTGDEVTSVVRPMWVDNHFGQVIEVRPVDDPEYLEWVAAGNTPEPWNPEEVE